VVLRCYFDWRLAASHSGGTAGAGVDWRLAALKPLIQVVVDVLALTGDWQPLIQVLLVPVLTGD
jgi:hypothetical protein